MAKWTYLIFLLLLMDLCYCKRGGGGSYGRRGSSRGKSTSSTSSSSSGGWFSWGSSSSHAAAPAPKPATTNYGFQKPASAPSAPPLPGGSNPSYGWTKPGAKPATTNTAWQKPAVPGSQPHQNIGPGGYPVQPGLAKPPAYSATNPMGSPPAYPNAKPPAYSPTNTHTRVAPPAYSPAAPSYNGPKKQVINNHYHYGSPQSHGMSSQYYPPQNNFGYPSGNWGNSRPSYGGMGMFSGGNNGYGYPSGGSWGGYGQSYGSRSGSGGLMKGLLIGAATGYVANSLIRTVTNPWGYSGYGYGSGYMDRYRYDRYDDRRPTPAPAAPAPIPENNWINCVAFDPTTRQTLINPNCTCTVSTTTDPATGQNLTHHDCTPFNPNPSMVTQPPFPGVGYGVNNPPPNFNQGSMHSGVAYGGGYPVAEGAVAATAVAGVQAEPGVVAVGETPVSPTPPVSQPQSDMLVGDAVHQKRAEFYSQLEKIVNMGRFVR